MEEKGTSILEKPYIRNPVRTEQTMLMVLISLLPASVFGVWRFGWKALGLLLLSAGVCVLTEFLYEKFRGQPITVGDCSAAVTGLLLALSLPVSVPWWMPAVGGIFAILAAKQLFGGLGKNILNPALAARLLLQILFSGFLEDGAAAAIGEASVLALIIGAMLLIWFDIITLRIPGAYIGCYLAVLLIFGGRGADLPYLAVNLFSGGVVLGAFFMATDYVTSPLTKSGRLLYGCVIGILTGIFRLAGSFAAGVACAVLIGNLLAPLIDRLTVPVPFGRERRLPKLGSLLKFGKGVESAPEDETEETPSGERKASEGEEETAEKTLEPPAEPGERDTQESLETPVEEPKAEEETETKPTAGEEEEAGGSQETQDGEPEEKASEESPETAAEEPRENEGKEESAEEATVKELPKQSQSDTGDKRPRRKKRKSSKRKAQSAALEQPEQERDAGKADALPGKEESGGGDRTAETEDTSAQRDPGTAGR